MGKHTILLVQPTRAPATRTFYDYPSVSEAVDCELTVAAAARCSSTVLELCLLVWWRGSTDGQRGGPIPPPGRSPYLIPCLHTTPTNRRHTTPKSW